MKKRGQRAQIWIETVIYTLIGLTIMGIILGVATPKIKQMNDNLVIEQSSDSLSSLNEQIRDTLTYAGNQREVLLSVKKGEYTLDGTSNVIYFTLKSTGLKYSEPNETFKQGDIYITTVPKGNKKYDVSLLLNYSNFNITYQNLDQIKVLTAAPIAYKLLIINENGKQIEFEPI